MLWWRAVSLPGKPMNIDHHSTGYPTLGVILRFGMRDTCAETPAYNFGHAVKRFVAGEDDGGGVELAAARAEFEKAMPNNVGEVEKMLLHNHIRAAREFGYLAPRVQEAFTTDV